MTVIYIIHRFFTNERAADGVLYSYEEKYARIKAIPR